MTISGRPRGTNRRERIARAAIGMPANHPESITQKPSRAEWRQLAAWLSQMWPNDEYAAIVSEALRRDHP